MKKDVLLPLIALLAIYQAGAGQDVYYYEGAHKVAVTLATDEISIRNARPVDTGLKLRHRLRGADASAASRSSVFALATDNLDSLQKTARSVRADLPAAEVSPVLYAGKEKDEDRRITINSRINFKLPEGQSPAAITEKYGLTDVRSLSFNKDIYSAHVPTSEDDLLATIRTANRIQESGEALWAAPVTRHQEFPQTPPPNDPLFGQQWPLVNTGTNSWWGDEGEDINILPAWDVATGVGVNVGLLDYGVDLNHPDLAANLLTDIDYDFVNDDDTPEDAHGHGTHMAGLIGAVANNNIGIAGVAPGSKLAAIKVLNPGGNTDTETRAEALAYHNNHADPSKVLHVSLNAYRFAGWAVTPVVQMEAIKSAALTGRDGKGTVLIWATGNNGYDEEDANEDERASTPYGITVGTSISDGTYVDDYEAGACILINAPTGHSFFDEYVYTTDIVGSGGSSSESYAWRSGASVSAAHVAGVVALMLEANPDLTYRDVMHILVNTAVQNDSEEVDWITNGAGKPWHPYFGFGRVDAHAAVSAAQGWVNVPPSAEPIVIPNLITDPVTIPDGSEAGALFSIPMSVPANFVVEHVEVTVDITHPFQGDVQIELISPAATTSELKSQRIVNEAQDVKHHTFRSVANWGENLPGNWTVKITDWFTGDVGTVNHLSVTFHGYGEVVTEASNWELYE